MAKVMRHPYYGDIVQCADLDGQQHPPSHQLEVDECDVCLEAILTCEPCAVVVSCCGCGAYHAFECPWPL